MVGIKRVSGTRDFYGSALAQRQALTRIISAVYENYGYERLETPAFEHISLLKNVYGQENEKLLYRILNSGERLNDIKQAADIDSISDKCLRYDLTLPLIRYVIENKGSIIFPFKRWQLQPVWRGDRPQKGRFREFHQCDVDIVGERSLMAEVEMLQIAIDVLQKLGIKDYTIHINHRGILFHLSQLLGIQDRFLEFCRCIDKIDKCGLEKFFGQDLSVLNITPDKVQILKDLLYCNASNEEKIHIIKKSFENNKISLDAIVELKHILEYIKFTDKIKVDYTLSRGLDYYTGMIFEVTLDNIQLGSVAGGGRYDYFSNKLNIPELRCVGFSFGVDRLLVAIEELGINMVKDSRKKILFLNENDDFDDNIIQSLRGKYIVEIFLDKDVDLKHQLKFANKKHFDNVVIRYDNKYFIKDMCSGEQKELRLDDLNNL